MRAHSSLRLGTLHGTTPELLASPGYCAWGFCMVWEAGSPTRRPLLPLNAGTAEPVRVSPPEAVAYLLELQALRAIMEQVYALFDRRCRPQTALDKLAKLRRRVQRFTFLGDTLKKLFAPTLEKALTFLDDTLLPSTSNAVERGNRRYRKMQKHVYRVRTQVQIRARWALDMWREAQAEGRQQTLASLHQARAG